VDQTREYQEIGVRSFGRGIFHKEPVAGTDLGNKRVFQIEPGDLVISNVFAWEGAIAVASGAEAGRIGSHRFMTFVAIDDRIETSWAAWFFRSEPGLELIGRASPGSAGRNRTLAIDRFESLEIPAAGDRRAASGRPTARRRRGGRHGAASPDGAGRVIEQRLRCLGGHST
jgi:type I restriction enzyme S subunit